MRIWSPRTWKSMPKQILLGQNKEFAGMVAGNMLGQNHKTVQYALDDEVEKLIALRVKFYDFVKANDIFNIDDKAGIFNYINSRVGFSDKVDIKKVIKYYKQNRIYDHHDEKYFIECLDNLWGKMTGKIKHHTGRYYSDKHRSQLADMFENNYKWYIDNKVEQYYHYNQN